MSLHFDEPRTVLPPRDRERVLDVSRFLEASDAPAMLLGPDGQQVELPEQAFGVLCDVVAAMRDGKAITIAPLDQVLTTQQAADFLGISRPTLVKLLESGEIDFERPGTGRHRKVRLSDLLEYQERHRRSRRQLLDEMVDDAVATGAYSDPGDFLEASRAVRQG